MWAKRDWMAMGVTAAVVCGAVVMGIGGGHVIAGDPVAVGTVAVPTFHVGNCTVTGAVEAGEGVTVAPPAADGRASAAQVVTVAPGALPKVKLTVTNGASVASEVKFVVAVTTEITRDRMSRVPTIRKPVYSQEYDLSLSGNETREIEVDAGAKVEGGMMARVMVQPAPADGKANPGFGGGIYLVQISGRGPAAAVKGGDRVSMFGPEPAAAPATAPPSPAAMVSIAERLRVRRAAELAAGQ